MFLAAASQRTRRILLGHGIVLTPPGYNHPARVAEHIATLDLVSNGRVDWGTGESASCAEREGFGVTPAERRAMWREAVEQTANMLVMDPYPGFQGKYFSMPPRHVSADVVSTDGRFIRAGADHDAELFWGLRGGGGNFGIVTSFEYRVGPAILAGPIYFALEDAVDVLRFYRDFAAAGNGSSLMI